jgi:UDP-N-acetylglucosamine:LPS N-acetylglucosamine transferase
LSDQGAAVLVGEREIDTLPDVVTRLRDHPAELEALSTRASALGAVHRSGALAELVESASSG